MDWSALTSMTPTGAIVLVLALPYLMMAMGRLQPRKNVEDWRDAYFKSEGARAVDRETTSQLLKYAETTDTLLRAALTPGLEPQDREAEHGNHG